MESTSKKLDLKIVNGMVLTTTPNGDIREVRTDLGIYNERIVCLGDLSLAESKETLNAKGLHVLPGIIDSQVHFREPGGTHKEDLESGTKAAVLGGITAVFDMPNTSPPTTNKETYLEKLSLIKGRAWCDVGFYIGASSENIGELHELEKLESCPGIKIFMGSSTGSLLIADDDTLEKVLKAGKGPVAVHCEDEDRLLERKHIAIDGKSARFHPVWRDEESALKATQRLIRLAQKTQRHVHILHVSTSQEVEFLSANKNWASIEVLPQHLTLSSPECYERLGNFAQQNPPIRTQSHQAALWHALEKGIIDVIASDHAPHTVKEKKKEYPGSPSGMPGVQTLVPIMLNHINQNRLSLAHFVKLASLNPSRIFKLRDHGQLCLNSVANLTIVDLKAEKRIENKWIASRCGWTAYDGMKVKGWVTSTILRGQMVMLEDQVLGNPDGKALVFNHSDS
jgi:dihydroorotase